MDFDIDTETDGESRIFDVLPAIISFSFISVFFCSLYLLYFGVINDYVLSSVQDVIESLALGGLVSQTTVTTGLTLGTDFLKTGAYVDILWAIIYLTFLGSTIYYCYKCNAENHFTMFTYLFLGSMFVLFMFSIYLQISVWFKANFLDNLFPNIATMMPMFNFWFNWAGVFTLVHLLVCGLVVMYDLDINNFMKRKDKEKMQEVL